MKKYFFISLLLFIGIFSACSSKESELVGKWDKYTKHSYASESIEFLKDKSGIYHEDGMTMAIKWDVVLDDGRIKVELEALGTTVIHLGTRENNILVFHAGGKKTSWVRANSKDAEKIQNKVRITQLFTKAEKELSNNRIDTAIALYKDAAIEGHSKSQNALAWIYATYHNRKYRNGERAVDYALKATSQEPGNYEFFATLAAAYARGGQFDKSIEANHKATSLYPTAIEGRKMKYSLSELYNRAIYFYNKKKPYSIQKEKTITYAPTARPQNIYIGEGYWRVKVKRKTYYECPPYRILANRTGVPITGSRVNNPQVKTQLPYSGHYGGILFNGLPLSSRIEADKNGHVTISLNLPKLITNENNCRGEVTALLFIPVRLDK